MRRPQIQEVVDGMGSAAANRRVITPPTNREENSVEGELDPLADGEFSLAPAVPPALRLFAQWANSSLIRVGTQKPGGRV